MKKEILFVVVIIILTVVIVCLFQQNTQLTKVIAGNDRQVLPNQKIIIETRTPIGFDYGQDKKKI